MARAYNIIRARARARARVRYGQHIQDGGQEDLEVDSRLREVIQGVELG